MGHDISGYNRAGDSIAYARFSMGNHNSYILYDVLDCMKFHAGVSGSGEITVFNREQLERASNVFQDKYLQFIPPNLTCEASLWDIKQMTDFIQNCLETTKREGIVKVYFG
ncbi:hypothetical protein Q73_01455 [Bacillus coahuilensis m2-6]|uniref:hypothetical protein n=1 Tax=Bacillus coahuilensis TaxID=408580 RepID=UPI0007504B47|nr:hypothetical protein [Bacillus coahuilensis]KUP09753.1 hypothetical protein Q73_01455 [Bacillus coahuilensis m2-6]